MVDGVFGMLDEVDRATVTLDGTKDIYSFDVALAAKAHSRLAKFIAVQHASDFALLDKLPDIGSAIVLAGRFDAGPYRAGMLDIVASLYSAGATDKTVTTAFGAITKAASGEVAMGATTVPHTSVQVFAIDDPKHVDQAVETLAKALATPRSFDFQGTKATIQTRTPPERHGDAKAAAFSFDYDTSMANAQVRAAMAPLVGKTTIEQVGTVGKVGFVTINVDPDRAADAIRGTGTTLVLDAALSAQVAAARARKDSVVAAVDVAFIRKSSVPLPMYMFLGYADGRAHLRFALPAASARGFATP
jgi:hypothetical protein